jgi:hypothetical protein
MFSAQRQAAMSREGNSREAVIEEIVMQAFTRAAIDLRKDLAKRNGWLDLRRCERRPSDGYAGDCKMKRG